MDQWSAATALLACQAGDQDPNRLGLNQVLQRRAGGGALLSIRIPVTRANRALLRQLRQAESEAWGTPEARLFASAAPR